jgi:hypothetical protein
VDKPIRGYYLTTIKLSITTRKVCGDAARLRENKSTRCHIPRTQQTLNAAFGTGFALYRLALPLGISFFTFQQLSYVIDSYRRTVPKYNILDYALFVTFFPQLVAGPIVLHSEIVPQFADAKNRRFRRDVACSEVVDGYTWYDIGTWSPAEGDTGYFWIALGEFDRKASSEHPDLEAVWIDQISFVAESAAEVSK